MSTRILLPTKESIGQMLEMLLGRTIETASIPEPEKPPEAPIVGVYVADDGEVLAVCLWELPLAAGVGAALSLLPKSSVLDSVKAGKLEENVGENLSEVSNIFAGLFNSSNMRRAALQKVYDPGELLPIDVRRIMERPAARVDVHVAVQGDYQEGTLSILSGLKEKEEEEEEGGTEEEASLELAHAPGAGDGSRTQ